MAGPFYPPPQPFVGGRQPSAPHDSIPQSGPPWQGRGVMFAAQVGIILASWLIPASPTLPPRSPPVATSGPVISQPMPVSNVNSQIIRSTWEPGPPLPTRQPQSTRSGDFVSQPPVPSGVNATIIRLTWERPTLPSQGYTKVAGWVPTAVVIYNPPFSRTNLSIISSVWTPFGPQPRWIGGGNGGDEAPPAPNNPFISLLNQAIIRDQWEDRTWTTITLGDASGFVDTGVVPSYNYDDQQTIRSQWEPKFVMPPRAPFVVTSAPPPTPPNAYTYPYYIRSTWDVPPPPAQGYGKIGSQSPPPVAPSAAPLTKYRYDIRQQWDIPPVPAQGFTDVAAWVPPAAIPDQPPLWTYPYHIRSTWEFPPPPAQGFATFASRYSAPIPNPVTAVRTHFTVGNYTTLVARPQYVDGRKGIRSAWLMGTQEVGGTIVSPSLLTLGLTAYAPQVFTKLAYSVYGHQVTVIKAPGYVVGPRARNAAFLFIAEAQPQTQVAPPSINIAFTGYAPTVTVEEFVLYRGSDNEFYPTPEYIAPSTIQRVGALFGATGSRNYPPPPLNLGLTVYQPIVTLSNSPTIGAPLAALALTANAPTVVATAGSLITPAGLTLSLQANAPSVAVTGNVIVFVPSLALNLTGIIPGVQAGPQVSIPPVSLSLSLTAYTPTIYTVTQYQRCRALTLGYYDGQLRQPGDVFDVRVGDFSDGTINYGPNSATVEFGWMASVPASTPLYSKLQDKPGPSLPQNDPRRRTVL